MCNWGFFEKPAQRINVRARVFFFLLWPLFARAPRHCFLENFCCRPGCEKCFFFCCAPLGAATFRRGRSKKKHPGWCFFFLLWPRAGTGLLLPLPFPGAGAKKNHPGWCFFLLRPRADAHSLTAGLGGDASPSPGWCFFFCCGPARTGVVFFFLLWPRPDAHSLTVGWGDFGKARVVFFFFFAAAPPGLFRQ